MAFSAIKSEEEKKEFFDPPELLEEKCEILANMILGSKYCISFTGAGISTSSGIPDYRSGYNTVLPTGPGCWEKAANRKKYTENMKAAGKKPVGKIDFNKSIQQAYPSKTHMALIALRDKGYLKHVISSNIDGLHRKSGFGPDEITEVHGNTNLEVCCKCGADYMRDFKTSVPGKGHKTGRKCDNLSCNGDLKDSIINFGENLDADILNRGWQEGGKADLAICMGSSMRVTPSVDMPVEAVKNEDGHMVIINLQKTPRDEYASMVIHGLVDDVMDRVMKHLDIKIPKWTRIMHLAVSVDSKNEKISVCGVDTNGAPYELFRKAYISNLTTQTGSKKTHTFPVHGNMKQPFKAELPKRKAEIPAFAKVQLKFHGHYKECDLAIQVDTKQLMASKKLIYKMTYDPVKQFKWTSVECLDKSFNKLGDADFSNCQ